MTQPLDFLVPEPHREASAWHWATVASTAPLRVKLDGAQGEVLDATPDTLVYGLATGNRVRVHISGRRAVVVGVAGGTPPMFYAMAAGTLRITTPSGGGITTETVNFPPGRFTVNPHVFVNYQTTSPMTRGASAHGRTTTSFQLSFAASAGTTVSVNWMAVQMTASSASG